MNYFKCSDFPLAVSLLCLGFQLEHIDRSNLKRAKFCFKKSDELDDAVNAFWHGQLKIEPKIFCMNQKVLKSQLYSQS